MYFDSKFESGKFVALELAKNAMGSLVSKVNPLLGAVTNAGFSYLLGDAARAQTKGSAENVDIPTPINDLQ